MSKKGNKALRFVGIGAIIIVGLVVGGIAFVSCQLGDIVKKGVEREGSKIIGTPVKVGDVDLSIFSGEGTISDFTVENPPGFNADLRYFMKVKTIQVKVDPGSVLDSDSSIIVHEVIVDQANVSVVTSGFKTNIGRLRDNLRAAKQAEESQRKQGESARKLLIEHFQFKNGSVNLALATPITTAKRSFALPDVELRNVGGTSGGEVAENVANEIFEAIAEKAKASVGDKVAPWRNKIVDTIGNKIRGIFGNFGVQQQPQQQPAPNQQPVPEQQPTPQPQNPPPPPTEIPPGTTLDPNALPENLGELE